MIQMRWIVQRPTGTGIPFGNDGQAAEMVLQFRESRTYTLGDTTHTDYEGQPWQQVMIGFPA